MSWRQFVISPEGFDQTSVLSAAAHAGCTAVLSLGALSDRESSSSIENLIKRDAGAGFGVSVPFVDARTRSLLELALGRGLQTVVITEAQGEQLSDSIEWCRFAGLESIVEVTSLTEAARAVTAGADGLIAKGSECGGKVAEETIFVLLQQILPRVEIPVYARGGIGLYTASACLAAGASGIALDWQLALAEESTLPEAVKVRIGRMDGSETAVLGQDSSHRVRAYARVGEAAYFELKKFEEREGIDQSSDEHTIARWKRAVADAVEKKELLLIGQDAAFAKRLAEKCRNVQGICRAIRVEASRQVRVASRLNSLGENSPLAKSQKVRFPIHQGPMTRVSDNADFAVAVANGGAVPYLALALMRGPEVAKLLAETQSKLSGLPWGVGILGFVPKELRDEQLNEVRKYKPPFMIIAGGRPDMAKQFESEAIQVYLHVPSPELARSFLESGARRLIFEGRECGGHVGPRTSFVLWEQMTQVVLDHLRSTPASKAEEYEILFAGGLHDAVSGAMLSAIAAPLAERGVRIGGVIGTGYLFTDEIVSSGAITKTFQEQALACQSTVLVESGVGHATRCADSQFALAFSDLKRRLHQEQKPKEEIREQLESLNLGRLRIASKGVVRSNDSEGRGVYARADEETVRREGMFMIGQVAALRASSCTVLELHQSFCSGSDLLKTRSETLLAEYRQYAEGSGSEIAVVGLSCVFPESNNPPQYWQNIINQLYAIREVPAERFDVGVYFDADRKVKDKIYSRWGGFIDDIVIDPIKFGMPPSSLASIDPLQLVTLEIVYRALQDAGYTDRRYDRENTCCVVGTGGGVGELGLGYGIRSMLPFYVDQAGGTLADSAELIDRIGKHLPDWTEDSFAGLLLNVVAGRVANRFDFGGTNFIVDAACATSLAALRNAVSELETKSSNVAVVAASDMMQSAFTYLSFSKTQALSPTGRPRVFDEAADGIVISEGVACAVLKRLEDAILDGDKIYGVIRSVGASSDGKDKGLTAPRSIGQMRALERAYKKAGVDPRTVGLVEAHGTGTAVGDRTEVEALATFFAGKGADRQSVALGSVKSMIGHTKCAAGFAGLFKAIMALRHQVLPSTLGVAKPNAKACSEQSPLYINSATRPWLPRLDGAPRRAGINAFGFGGTNFHVVAEEFLAPEGSEIVDASARVWPAELFLFRKKSARDLSAAIALLSKAIEAGARPAMADLAYAVYWEHGRELGPCCLAVVAQTPEDLLAKLQSAVPVVESGHDYREPKGVYYSSNAEAPVGKIAFMFPGQGSQSLGMLNDLALAFPQVRKTLEDADRSLGLQLGRPLSSFIFPPPVFSDAEREENEESLKQTNVAQPALGAADMAMFRLLADLGIVPDAACGHSYGEFAALAAAGSFTFEDLIRISELRGRVIIESAEGELGAMAAVEAGAPQVTRLIENFADAVIANINGPTQTVISGTKRSIEEAVQHLKGHGLKARSIPVACAFHSPLVAGATEPLRKGLSACDLKTPRFDVYSNTTAMPHSGDAETTRQLLADHLSRPVRFAEEIDAMYAAGCRVFVECGPGRVLTGLAASCLSGRSHSAIPMDQPGRSGLLQLVHSLAQLGIAGVHFYASRIFEGRVVTSVTLDKLLKDAVQPAFSPTAWVVTNGRAVPAAKLHDPAWSALPPSPETRASGKHILLKTASDETQVSSVAGAAIANHHLAPPPPAAPAMHNSTQPEPSVISPAAAEAPTAVEAGWGSVPPRQVETIMQGHHRLMSAFLETHRKVMLAGLQPQSAAVMQSVALPTGPTIATLARPEAGLNPTASPVVTVKPVRIVESAPTETAIVTVVSAAVSVKPVIATPDLPADAPVTREAFARILLELVSQRTGYPVESLDIDLDLEADLGVDSIKRIEIFSALQSESVLPGKTIDGQFETLSKLKTLRAIVDWIEARLSDTAAVPIIVAAPALAPAPSPTRITKENISKVLLELISQRTGYPIESLEIDLDLEADLGVDSIKRVEIFSALQSESVLPSHVIEGQFEVLSKLKTLRAIVDWIDARICEPAAGARNEQPMAQPDAIQPPPPASDIASSHPVVKPVTRLIVEFFEAPLRETSTKIPSPLLVTNDGGGIAESFCAGLTKLGISYCLVTHSPSTGTDLQDPASVTNLLKSATEKYGAISGLIHLMPLAPVHDGLSTDSQARSLFDLRTLFLATKGLEKQLRGANGILMSASRLGGKFGFGSDPAEDLFPGNGAIAGFVKTVAREWPEVSARVVDFSKAEKPETIARLLLNELSCRDGLLEVGYSSAVRGSFHSVPSALPASSSNLHLNRDSVVLLTGGARGITAAVAMELAQAFQLNLVLLGRSPLPSEEPDDIAGITDPRQLRRALIDRVQTGGQRLAPAVVEGLARRVTIDREIRHNLAHLRALGSRVEYHAADVSDAAAMKQIVAELYRKHGKIDGAVHGAGVIEDKYIGDKTLESFDRVIRPKMFGAHALVDALRPESLQFLVFFSSVSARYGNRGQCDYAAANEYLNKLAVALNHKWPGRVVSMNWGPWKTEGGMVSDELASRFSAAGVEMIDVPAGRQAFLRELLSGTKRDVEVVFGGPLTTHAGNTQRAETDNTRDYPLVAALSLSEEKVTAELDSHPERHVFLKDHQIEGKPVLPMMAALEILAEVGVASNPLASFSSLKNLRNFQGITYPNGGRSFRVEGVPESGSGRIELALRSAPSGQLHYRGVLEFGIPVPPAPARLQLINSRPFPLSTDQAYKQWLFHGPLFAGIREIVAMGDNGIIGRIKTVAIEELIEPPSPGQWVVDPVVTDSSLQLVLLWARAVFDQTPLPSALDAYHHVRPLHEASEIVCEIEITRVPGTPTLRSRHVFYDQHNQLLGWMEGMESTMSRALNRISEKGALVSKAAV